MASNLSPPPVTTIVDGDDDGGATDLQISPAPKAEIAAILEIPMTDDWEIVDSDPEHNLYLVHYTEKADLSRFGDLRGVVVDTNARVVVCRSYGYTPTVTLDEISPGPSGSYHFRDAFGNDLPPVDPNKAQIRLGFEGTMIRAFLHHGEMYLASHKRLDTSRSTWGNSIAFQEMYYVLGGPPRQELFDPLSSYSPYCHIFLMVHPDVLYVTKDRVGKGYLVYLGPRKMWSTDPATGPFKQTDQNGRPIGDDWSEDTRPNAGWVNPDVRIPETVAELPEQRTGRIIFSPYDLTLEEANRHLRYGFYQQFDDGNLAPELRAGEFIMIYTLDQHGQTTGLIKVQSRAYEWRAEMRDNDPNLNFRFYQLINGAYIRTDQSAEAKALYTRKFPLMTKYSVESVIDRINKDGPFIVWPQDDIDDDLIKTPTDRLSNIWRCFLMSVPLHRQKDVVLMYDQFIKDREAVISWLIKMEDRTDVPDVPDRAVNIISTARSNASQRTQEGKNVDRKGRKLSLKAMTRHNIRNLIMKENGRSLYRLVRTMRNFEAEST